MREERFGLVSVGEEVLSIEDYDEEEEDGDPQKPVKVRSTGRSSHSPRAIM